MVTYIRLMIYIKTAWVQLAVTLEKSLKTQIRGLLKNCYLIPKTEIHIKSRSAFTFILEKQNIGSSEKKNFFSHLTY